MKREYIIFKVYAECPLLSGWLRLGSDKGIFELVDSSKKADFSYNLYKANNAESARLVYELIRKNIIDFVYEMLFIECQTWTDYDWLEDQVFFGQKMSKKLCHMITGEKIIIDKLTQANE